MQTRKLIVANWKMNLNASQASLLLHRLHERIKIHRDVEVVLAPSTLLLQPLSQQIDRRKFRLSAQNAHQQDHGPFTGEVSFTMLRDLVHYAIIGHSDRRHKFGETLDQTSAKVAAAVRNGIVPILCVGETAHERAEGKTKRVIHDQVTTALAHLTSRDVQSVVIAYEPVWALSSGDDFAHHKSASAEDIAAAVECIRHNVHELYGPKAAKRARVLYGGSSNAENAKQILSVDGIDGLLVGGASLDYLQFAKMIENAHEVALSEG